MKKKCLSLLLALALVLSLAACGGGNNTPTQDPAPAPSDGAAEPSGEPAGFQPLTYDEDAIYEANFGEFLEYYNTAKEAEDVDTRRALMAVAEAKLLESAPVIPGTAGGGSYQMRRTATHTTPSVAYGTDGNRLHQYVVVGADEMITASEIDEINAQWRELAGTGTFLQWVQEYLTGKGYTLRDTLNQTYSADPTSWDVLATGEQQNTKVLAQTYDSLMVYDVENVQQPGLALNYDVSEDGTVYTFHLRPDVPWVDSQGREIAKVQADDFVAGMQHLLDAKGGLEWLVSGLIVNAEEYINGEITDFAQVGVKAVDELTVEYTLCAPTPYLPTMLGYGIFAPLCRTYYQSQGGKFGAEFSNTASDYTYGKGPDSIAYCGPFLVTSFTPKNSIVFQANPTYWDKENIIIQTNTWTFDDGTDASRAYNDFLSGKCDFFGMSATHVELAKEAGLFDEYVRVGSVGSTSWYIAFNLDRRMYNNFNDVNAMASPQSHGSVDEITGGAETSEIEDDAARTHAAVNNRHFRLAIAFAFDRASYMAQGMGEDLKYVRLRNTFVPGDYVKLEADTTIEINGTSTTFPAGTLYGEIVQAQIDADGFPLKVCDPSTGADDPTTGFDGWYSLDNAKAEFEQAVAELAAQGVEVSAENPIFIDLPFAGMQTSNVNQAEVYRQCMEKAFGGAVQGNLIAGNNWEEVDGACFYPEAGADHNYDLSLLNVSWTGDWGDPNTYLDVFTPSGAQISKFGIFG